MQTTRLFSKGQLILPKSLLDAQAWGPGTEFTVESTSNGIVLRPVTLFPPTALDEVAGCLRSRRKPTTAAQMRAAIDKEVLKRHDRRRY